MSRSLKRALEMREGGDRPIMVRAAAAVGVALMALLFLLAACRAKPPADPFAIYRPAMRSQAVGDLDLSRVHQLPRYWLTFTVNYRQRSLQGTERVLYTHRSSTPVRDIYLRLYPNLHYYGGEMAITNVTVNGTLSNFDYGADHTVLRLPLSFALGEGQQVDIGVRYTLKAPEKPAGRYVIFGLSQSVLSLPLAYPVLAVYTPSGWALNSGLPMGDTLFSESALYHVSAAYSQTLTAVHAGTLVARQPITSSGTVRETYVTGPVREFAFFLSPNYHFVEKNVDGVRFRSYYLTGDETNGAIAETYGKAIFRIYQRKFGFYPYNVMNVVETPITYRGMEYANMATLGVQVYRDKHDSMEFLLAHEMGHQWWYNMVGNDQVTYPWLDEGLTEYSTTAYYDAIYGPQRSAQIEIWRWKKPWQYLVQQGLDATVNQPESAFTPANYETIVYGKGALFFAALRHKVGDAMYYRILHTYWQRYKYGIATPADFLDVASEVSGMDLHGLYQEWVLSHS